MTKKARKVATIRLLDDWPLTEGQSVDVGVGFTGMTKACVIGRVTSVLSDRATIVVGGKAFTFLVGERDMEA